MKKGEKEQAGLTSMSLVSQHGTQSQIKIEFSCCLASSPFER
jgi:hypothetical protein